MAKRTNGKKSEAVLRRCLNDYPKNDYLPEIHYALAWAEKNQGQLDAARKRFNQVVTLTNSLIGARAQLRIGDIDFEQKKHDDAITAYFEVFRGYEGGDASFHPLKAQALWETGRCFEAKGQPKKAVKYYQELIQEFPKQPKAKQAKDRVEHLSG